MVVFDEFGDAGDAGGDDGAAGGHGFHEDDGDAFGDSWGGRRVGGVLEEGGDFVLADVAEEMDAGAEAHFVGEGFEGLAAGAIAGEGNREVVAAEEEVVEGLVEDGGGL